MGPRFRPPRIPPLVLALFLILLRVPPVHGQTTWYFAEGATGYFDEEILLANAHPSYAERSVYWGPGWDGGHNAKGREWKWAIGTPPPPPAVDPPVISPPPGTYANAVSVSMDAAPGASVRYTTDGTEPTQSSTLYGGPFLLDGLPTIKARAYAAGFSPSAVTTNSPYTFQVADPRLDPPGGTYTASTSVSATSSTNGATLRYTTDGSTPTESSSLYTSPLPMANMVLKVRAFKPGYSSSNVIVGTYALQAGAPAFDPPAGTYAPGQEISLHAEPGATVRFTTDGTDPTEGSPAYSSPVTLIADMTMKARAYAPGAAPSEVVSAQYVADSPSPTAMIPSRTRQRSSASSTRAGRSSSTRTSPKAISSPIQAWCSPTTARSWRARARTTTGPS